MELKTIAKRLRGIRKACGFTQQQVAAVLNVDRSTYTYYETGKTSPDIHTVKTLAELFNVSVNELLYEEGILHSEQVEEISEEEPLPEDTLPMTANRLTRTERELLLCYRALPMEERSGFLQELYEKLELATGRNKTEN